MMQNLFFVIILITIISLVLCSCSHFYISLKNICVSGNYAYAGDLSNGLLIFNISDPSEPFLTGYYDLGNAIITDSIAVGNYLYTSGDGLRTFNVSDPSNPVLVSSYDCGHSTGIFLSGNFAYVSIFNGESDLMIFDLSDPANPSYAGSYNNETESGSESVFVVDNYAYLTPFNNLLIIDISDPANPILVGTFPGGYGDIYVVSDYAYLPGYTFTIADVSIPSNPVLAGSCYIENSGGNVTVDSDYAFLTRKMARLILVNISDPAQPVVETTYSIGSITTDVYIRDNLAYLADDDGLLIAEISDPQNPVLLGSCDQ